MERERRNQIILTIVGTLAGAGLIYSLVITRLQYEIEQDQQRLRDKATELHQLGAGNRRAWVDAEKARRE